jgi:hypothetical protein
MAIRFESQPDGSGQGLPAEINDARPSPSMSNRRDPAGESPRQAAAGMVGSKGAGSGTCPLAAKPGDEMVARPVSRLVNDARRDEPACVEPMG